MMRSLMLFDANGIPYTLGLLTWDATKGVRHEKFVCPVLFDTPESIYARSDEVKSGASQHYGNVLSHHAQQLLALHYLRECAGFDELVWCETHFTDHVSIMVLRVTDGAWCEQKEKKI